MPENDAVESFNVKGLDQILKALKTKPPIARVGILGSTNARSGKQNSNATIGAAHEFGTTKMPQRSFLRVPISENLNKSLESSGLLTKETLQDVIKWGSVLPWVTKVAIVAEGIVLDAFASNGFGKWAPWKGSYTSSTGQILVNSQQLRNSISYEVKS